MPLANRPPWYRHVSPLPGTAPVQRARGLLLFALTGMCGAALASADVLWFSDAGVFRRVQVLGIDDAGAIEFRGLSRQVIRHPVATLTRVELADVPALSRAEKAAAAGRLDEASIDYARALTESSADWQRRLIGLRSVAALDQHGHFAEALRQYVRLLRQDPRSSAAAVPAHWQRATPENVSQALQHLSEARPSVAYPPARVRLDRLHVELLIATAAPRIPADLAGRASGDLPPGWEVEGGAAADPDLPPLVRRPPRGEPLHLLADSPLLHQARACVKDDPQRTLRIVERALPYVGPQQTAIWRGVRGQALYASELFSEAARELRVASGADPSGEFRYTLGCALARMGRADEARRTLEPLLAEPGIAAGLSEQIAARLQELER